MTENPAIAGILLGGGSSRRMGRPKQLLRIGDEGMLAHAAKNALTSNLDPLIIVLGHKADQVKSSIFHLLDNTKVEVAINDRYKLGMSESIKKGVALLYNRPVNGVMILLGDQPKISGTIINYLIREYSASGKYICQPVYGETAGNPVIFSRSLFPLLAGVEGDQGGRSIIRDHPEWVHFVKFSDVNVGIDLDTPEAYDNYLKLKKER